MADRNLNARTILSDSSNRVYIAKIQTRVHIRGRGFDGDGQIQDSLVLRCRMPDIDDRFADLKSKIDLGRGKAFWRVLQGYVGFGQSWHQLCDQSGAACCDSDNIRLIQAEDHAALEWRCRIVEMHNGFLRPAYGFEGTRY